MSSVAGVARTYDAVGNTSKIGSGSQAPSFVYNDTSRLSQLKNGNKVAMNYVYNGKGEQVRRYLGTANTYFAYDEAGHLLGEYDNAGAPVQQILWLDDLPVGVLAGSGTSQKLHYIEPDHLGTPRVIIDGTRNVAIWEWSIKGEAFGATPPHQNPDGDATQFVFNLRYPGQRYDSVTGFNYNYFRDYDPATGRYSESDPIGLGGGISTYAYAGGNPLSNIDPEGLDYWLESADPSESGLGLHQSICVGEYGTANRFCISFGRKPGQGDCWTDCNGHVYTDRSPPGGVLYPRHRKSDAATDKKIKTYLQSRLGEQRPWDVLGGENCRVFSQQVFDYLDKTYGGPAPPLKPPREPRVY